MGSLKLVAFLISIGISADGSAESMHLLCYGGGAANKVAVTSGFASSSSGQTVSGQAYGTRSVGFQDQVNIDIDGTIGRIRVPRVMLPPLHGGDGGWFEFKNIVVTDTEITGNAAINFINSPKVRLDRVTGQLNISGKAGDFSGECKPYDPKTAERRF